jgi:hypothetical protein
LGKNGLNEQECTDGRQSISQRKRKPIERVLEWGKPDRPLQPIELWGLKRAISPKRPPISPSEN